MRPNSTDIEYGVPGGCGGLVDLQTTIAGFEITLETLVEISALLKRLDERLAALSPELPQVGNVAAGGQSLSGTFSQMLTAYQDAFAAMANAARSAALLGLGGVPGQPVVLNLQTNPAPAVAPPAPAPAAPAAAAAATPQAPIEQVVVQEDAAPAPQPEVQVATPQPTAPVAQPNAQAAVVPQAPAASDLKPAGSIASQRFSAVAPSGKKLKSEAEMMKPLKPIEMPNAEHHVGPMITHGQATIYAHNLELRRHWPGGHNAKAKLEAIIPNDAWRLLDFGGILFAVAENDVTVFEVTNLHKQGTFQGQFVNQTHTASAWAGLLDQGGTLSIVFRDKAGRTVGDAIALGNHGGSQTFMASSGEAVYVAFGNGELFRVEGGGLRKLPNANKNGEVVGLGVDTRGLVLTNKGPQGIVLSLLDPNGSMFGESQPVAGAVSHPPALVGDKALLFDDARSEVVLVSLDTLSVVSRKPVEGVVAVGRLIALQEDGDITLAILATDKEGRPTEVLLHSVESGANSRVCRIGATKGDIAYADGHIVMSSTSSMQNMVQVFSVYGNAAAKAA